MKQRSSFVSIIVILGLLLAPTLSVAKEKKLKIYRVPQKKSSVALTIFKDPTTHSPVIKRLPAKTRWIVRLPGVKKYSRCTWLKVSWNNKKGWMKKSSLVFDAQATESVAKNPKCLRHKNKPKSCNSS